ncbi:alpha/beta fold hydrolase [Dactylosporangium siamense]|uniref:Hydrolase n=1 Tax=Dactylosporangium siamense TaxID=685454 RepID=A0A919PQ87_9ACTN|nr:alpha/beta hydrolase [Dactylosporangium siamense]GIG48900.1 hydrolase [Dactylosporangium siamense]
MPFVNTGAATLHYEETGTGDAVVLVPGTGAAGRTWRLHQVPALVAAGYRAITVDNRGVPPSDPAGPGLTVADLVADTAGLVERLAGGPCRLVGSSMGAHIVQELLLTRPDLATQAVLMGSRGRPDAFSRALAAAERSLHDEHVQVPAGYDATMRALRNLSPRTLQDDQAVQDWLDIFEMSAPDVTDRGVRAQLDVDMRTDRLGAYRRISTPTLVLSFADDLVAPAARGRELAAAIPGARYTEIRDAGHYGYLEQPDAVNAAMLRFFAGQAA